MAKSGADRKTGTSVRSDVRNNEFNCKDCPVAKFAIYGPTVVGHPDKVQIERMGVQDYEPNRIILTEGRPSPLVGTLRSGWAYAFKTLADGDRHLQYVLIPGDFLTVDLLFIGNRPLAYGVKALTEVSICWFEANTMRRILNTGEEQSIWTQYWTSYYLASLHARAAVMAMQDARGRLAQFFIEITDRLRYRRMGREALFAVPQYETPFSMSLDHQIEFRSRYKAEVFEFPLTQSQIAECLGLTTIYVNRVLKQFAADRVLELKRRSLHIHDIVGLTRLAADHG